jgi:hypothetical protein
LTHLLKKQRERFFVEEAARHFGKTWDLGGDRERPDFVVTEGGSQFGLEVTEIFMGPQGHSGSTLKAMESFAQRSLNELQRQYESIADVPLTAQFVGNMEADNLATVVPALVAQDLPSKSMGYHFVHDTTVLHPNRARLSVHVTKGRRNWFSVNDRVGFVDRGPNGIIAAAIEIKANDLARYKAAAGADVRLLLVANRINNSGRLALEETSRFDLHGFNAVYFFPYPEAVIVLDDAS